MTPPGKSDESPADPDHQAHLVPPHWDPVSFKTAWVFLRNFFKAILFLRGVLELLVLLLIGGAVMFWLVEDDVALLDSLYFAAITALTIGYGDIAPLTPLGKMVAIFIGVLGVIIMGILVAASVRALEFTLKRR